VAKGVDIVAGLAVVSWPMTTARNDKRVQLLRQRLARLAPKLLFGTASATYRTCGKPTCLCHQGARHGPYLHVSYRAKGRTQSFNVPAALQSQVRDGLEAWKELLAIARELAEHHRLALGLGRQPRRQRGRRAP
jgi:hypothetical protein